MPSLRQGTHSDADMSESPPYQGSSSQRKRAVRASLSRLRIVSRNVCRDKRGSIPCLTHPVSPLRAVSRPNEHHNGQFRGCITPAGGVQTVAGNRTGPTRSAEFSPARCGQRQKKPERRAVRRTQAPPLRPGAEHCQPSLQALSIRSDKISGIQAGKVWATTKEAGEASSSAYTSSAAPTRSRALSTEPASTLNPCREELIAEAATSASSPSVSGARKPPKTIVDGLNRFTTVRTARVIESR